MAPRSTEQYELIRRERLKQIMEAAFTVYAEKGYDAAEIGQIANEVGLARGLVYYSLSSLHTRWTLEQGVPQ